MYRLFVVYGKLVLLKARVWEWYAFYFKTEEYFNRVHPATAELQRQIDEGDWNAVRLWRGPQ